MEAKQHRPQGHAYEEDEDEIVGQGSKVGLKTALDDDPNAPKQDKSASNYQSKVTDPTGATAIQSEGAGKSMIGRLKGAASSWLRKGGGKAATTAAETPTTTSTTPHGT
ncbi:hypothetical protein HAX54_012264 [Datura stramonium]|uniref:LTI65/LTI78 NYQTKV repeat domain-containing protein n=1 Tax=Datura stramonium TaxID=4076 RepID=A0ABS8TMD4_DATST|nr:hypothetical protein [Datura stramonium]